MEHITVLLKEAVSALNLSKDSVVVDCTLGSGGHAREIISQLGPNGIYIGIDADRASVEENDSLHTKTKANVILVEGNFRDITKILSKKDVTSVDAIIADLGWRIEQFEGRSGEKRGFSFRTDEPLHMTFGSPRNYPFTAYDIVNEWDEEDIANVIYAYGEERYSRKIARAIKEARDVHPIETSVQLAELIEKALPKQRKKTHPATKTFQALRIAVNDEFDALRTLLQDGFAALRPGGRMAIISFHSLEDRIVKEVFRSYTHDQQAIAVTKKPLTPSSEELQTNPRARSAKLRVIEKR